MKHSFIAFSEVFGNVFFFFLLHFFQTNEFICMKKLLEKPVYHTIDTISNAGNELINSFAKWHTHRKRCDNRNGSLLSLHILTKFKYVLNQLKVDKGYNDEQLKIRSTTFGSLFSSVFISAHHQTERVDAFGFVFFAAAAAGIHSFISFELDPILLLNMH